MATVEETIQNIRLSTREDQVNRINLNSQYGAMGSVEGMAGGVGIGVTGLGYGGMTAGDLMNGNQQQHMADAERAMQERQRVGLAELRENFPQYVQGFLSEEIEDGQETSENIPEDKEALSIQVKKNKKGITLGVPKLAPIVTIYNLQEDIVLLDTSTLENDELMTREEFMDLMTIQIKKKEPVILKDGFYISVSRVSIAKDKVKANCYKSSNRYKVTEEEFFNGGLEEKIDNARARVRAEPRHPRDNIDSINAIFQQNAHTHERIGNVVGNNAMANATATATATGNAPVATYQDNPRWDNEPDEDNSARFQDDAHRARFYSEQSREERDVPQRYASRNRVRPARPASPEDAEINEPPRPKLPAPRYLEF